MADLTKCPITEIRFVTPEQLLGLNTDVTNTGMPLYIYNGTRLDGSILVYSTQVDSMPITTTRVDRRPCFDPQVQTTVGVYGLEL